MEIDIDFRLNCFKLNRNCLCPTVYKTIVTKQQIRLNEMRERVHDTGLHNYITTQNTDLTEF